MRRACLMVVVLAAWSPLAAQENGSSLFDDVVARLEKNYVDVDFRESRLPALVEQFRPQAEAATTLDAQRRVTHDLLSHLPATHMGLLSDNTFRHMMGELQNKSRPTFGFELMELDGKYFAHNVLEGGPAAGAGLCRGDRILQVDGQPVGGHRRLDWRSDDSYLPDPPVHLLLCEEGEQIELLVETGWGQTDTLTIPCQPWSAFESARASAMVIEDQSRRFGYIHFWMIHMTGVRELLKEKLEGDFADCDALILDLRGRGGNGMAIPGILDVLSGEKSTWDKPVVAIVNQYSRSAKEVIAWELKDRGIGRVVGERTAGAVIPASFARVGEETRLMYPTFRMGKYTELIEGVGVEPDVWVADAGPWSHGADPLLGAALREANALVDPPVVD